MLRTKKRDIENVYVITLKKSKAPSHFNWELFQNWRESEFQKLDSLKESIENFGTNVRCVNPRTLQKPRELSSPYNVNLTFLVKNPGDYGLIVTGFN